LVAMPYCRLCGSNAAASSGRPGCGLCPTPLPRFSRVFRLGPYDPPLRGIIKQFKYRRQERLCRRLGALLAGAIGAGSEALPDVVLAVPAHWKRRFARSFDHSRALAAAIARGLHVPLGDELVRIRHTPPQANLPRTRRIENVRGAFEARSSKALSGARVLLVDDVTTTGATANEATRAILKAGASEVVLAVIAKAQPPAAYAEH